MLGLPGTGLDDGPEETKDYRALLAEADVSPWTIGRERRSDMVLQSEIDRAFNRGLEQAAKLSEVQVFETKDRRGIVHRWSVGKMIAKMIRAKKRKAK